MSGGAFSRAGRAGAGVFLFLSLAFCAAGAAARDSRPFFYVEKAAPRAPANLAKVMALADRFAALMTCGGNDPVKAADIVILPYRMADGEDTILYFAFLNANSCSTGNGVWGLQLATVMKEEDNNRFEIAPRYSFFLEPLLDDAGLGKVNKLRVVTAVASHGNVITLTGRDYPATGIVDAVVPCPAREELVFADGGFRLRRLVQLPTRSAGCVTGK